MRHGTIDAVLSDDRLMGTRLYARACMRLRMPSRPALRGKNVVIHPRVANERLAKSA